ncbi:hypothetical protein PM082_008783 [Marasmius tenuissimus]|nr:hypothetical protein PM082_008783 [Marasmius tenuissimus]
MRPRLSRTPQHMKVAQMCRQRFGAQGKQYLLLPTECRRRALSFLPFTTAPRRKGKVVPARSIQLLIYLEDKGNKSGDTPAIMGPMMDSNREPRALRRCSIPIPARNNSPGGWAIESLGEALSSSSSGHFSASASHCLLRAAVPTKSSQFTLEPPNYAYVPSRH